MTIFLTLFLIYQNIICQSASDKKDQIWSQIIQNRNIYKQISQKQRIIDIFNYFTEIQPCDLQQDIIERKSFLDIGAQAQVQYIPTPNQKFTGLFEGGNNVILRLSSFFFPDTSSQSAKNNFIPKLQMKFFRNNYQSADISAMYSYLGTDTWNFFEYDLSTSINDENDLSQSFFNQKKSQCSNYIYNFGIKQLSTHNEWGQENYKQQYPYKLIFKANSQVKHMFRDVFQEIFTQQLKKIPINTNLYDVYGIYQPQNACTSKIGTIKLRSKFVTSSFADSQLHFSDLSVENDIQDNPEWEKYMTKWQFFGLLNQRKIEEGNCENINQISEL